MTTVHTMPAPGADLIDHEATEDCPCGPRMLRHTARDGGDAWQAVHHALDADLETR